MSCCFANCPKKAVLLKLEVRTWAKRFEQVDLTIEANARHLHIFFKVKVYFLKYTHSKEHGNCFKMVLHLLIYLN